VRQSKNLWEDKKGVNLLVCTLLLFAICVAGSGVTYGWVMSIASAQSQQAMTQVRIDLIQWDIENNQVIISVRNTGSVEAKITSIGIKDRSEDNFVDDIDCSQLIDIGVKSELVWNKGNLEAGTSYIIRVTCNTGFFYETIETSPSF
jgi:hypothetical protein